MILLKGECVPLSSCGCLSPEDGGIADPESKVYRFFLIESNYRVWEA